MGFLLSCPNCGERTVYEYRCGGEQTVRPEPGDPEQDWTRYFYLRRNVAGDQREWWYHAFGCRRWFIAVRDTLTNQVKHTYWPGEAGA